MPNIQFTDSIGNPLAAGLLTTIYNASTNTFVASGALSSNVNLVPTANLPAQNNWTLSKFIWSSVAGPNNSPAFVYFGTGTSSASATASSYAFNVKPGGTYNYSLYVNPLNVTSGNPVLFILDPTLTIVYSSLTIPTSAAGIYSGSVNLPSTSTKCVFQLNTSNCVVNNGSPLLFNQPEFYINQGCFPLTSTALVSSTNYYASFIGGLAPTGNTNSFLGNTSSVMITGFVSPTMDAINYVNTLISVLPRNWFSTTATTTGGNLYNILTAIAANLETIDNQTQQNIAMARLHSCVDSQLDSFAYDFFGNSLSRFPGEIDNQYRLRIFANLTVDKSTTSGILKLSSFFGSGAILSEPWSAVESQGCDGFLTCDSAGSEVGQQTSFLRLFITSNNQVSNAQLKSTILSIKPIGIPLELVNVISGQGTVL